jgi:hypothetical protein
MHLKPTAGCQISTLIFENKLWRGVSVGKNVAVLDILLWHIHRDPLHNIFSNIKVDI